MSIENLSPIARRLKRIDEFDRIKTKRITLVDKLESGPNIKLEPRKKRPPKTPQQVESQIRRIINVVLETDVKHTIKRSEMAVEVGNYKRAQRYQTDLTSLQSRVNDAAQGLAEGRVTTDEFLDTTGEYGKFVARHSGDDGIKKGLALIAEEEDWNRQHEAKAKKETEEARPEDKREETTVFQAGPVTPTGETPILGINRRVEPAKTRGRKEPTETSMLGLVDGFQLSDGTIIRGKIGELLTLIGSLTEEDSLLSTGSRLAAALYPDKDLQDAKDALSKLIAKARNKLRNYGFGIENVRPEGPQSASKEGYYRIIGKEDKTEEPIDRKPHTPESPIEAAAERIIKALSPASSTNIFTYSELKSLTGISDNEAFSAALDLAKSRLEEGMRVTSVRNRTEPEDEGLYIEERRKKRLPDMEVRGEEIQIGERKIRLTPQQEQVLWLFSQKGDMPKYRDELVEDYSRWEGEISQKDITRIVGEINTATSKVFGKDADDLIIIGGNITLGFWHKIYDAQVKFNIGFRSLPATRLSALRILFNSPNPDKNELKQALGKTGGRTRKPYPLTSQQADRAFGNAIIALRNRSQRGMLTDTEKEIFDQMRNYKGIHGLSRDIDLIKRISEILGVRATKPAQPAQRFDVTPDLQSEEPIYQPNRESKFFLWDEEDVAILATAFLSHGSRLAPIFKANNILAIDEDKLKVLSEMEVDDPELEPTSDKKKEKIRESKLRKKRNEALDRVIAMMKDPNFKKRMDVLYDENVEVWELIMKITELSGVRVQYGDMAVDLPLTELEGVEILKRLFTDPNGNGKDFYMISVRERRTRDIPDNLRADLNSDSRKAKVVFDSTKKNVKRKNTRRKQPTEAKPENKPEKQKREKRSGTALEQLDPEIRKRVFGIFDIVMTNPSFAKSPEAEKRLLKREEMLEEFPIITQESLNDFMMELEARHTSRKKPQEPRFGVRDITALYYESQYGINLTSQQKKKLRQFVYDLFTDWYNRSNNIDRI